ncbi:MAG: helix-turn-helix transcriptional regulator [Sebaldella sp.]|nr:helix-turn-helix transcriptional regulator [Sebaldella sp.]
MSIKINEVAQVLSDKSCSKMLILLMDGKFHTVTELAKIANVKNHTATYHIKKFINLNWVEIHIQGRFHYYRLSDTTVAEIVEQWMPIAKFQPVRSLNMNIENKILFNGRTCYDHLAGKLGIELSKWYLKNKYFVIEDSKIDITNKGVNFFNNCEINIEELKKLKRHFSKICLDWSEREYHISGSIGKAITDNLFENKWIEHHGKTRGIRLTELGEKGLSEKWGASEVVDNYKKNYIK